MRELERSGEAALKIDTFLYSQGEDKEKRKDMNYEELSKEELLDLLDHPECIETGGEPWEGDEAQEYEVKQIKNILVDKYGMRRKDL